MVQGLGVAYMYNYGKHSYVIFILLGSELKSWLLYYSLPVLKGILPLPYYSHYGLLVRSVHILTSDSIKADDLERVEIWLKQFYEQYQDLYGKNTVTL